MDHSTHRHDVGPAGATYDLRFLDGMVQHHTGALRMSEFIFGIGTLLAMVNSCAGGVGVVNVDNGFGAAQVVARMLAHP